MTTTQRLKWVVLLCATLNGCAALPLIGMNVAGQAAKGLVAMTLGPLSDAQDESNPDRCALVASKGISITESLEAVVPINEGTATTFEPAWWRTQFAREGYPQVEGTRTPAEVALAVTDRSILFVPAPGATMVRIPYELVQGIDVNRDANSGEPRAVVVKSCLGRFDIVIFARRPLAAPDTAMTTAAEAQLTTALAAFRKAQKN